MIFCHTMGLQFFFLMLTILLNLFIAGVFVIYLLESQWQAVYKQLVNYGYNNNFTTQRHIY